LTEEEEEEEEEGEDFLLCRPFSGTCRNERTTPSDDHIHVISAWSSAYIHKCTHARTHARIHAYIPTIHAYTL